MKSDRQAYGLLVVLLRLLPQPVERCQHLPPAVVLEQLQWMRSEC